MKYVLKPSSAVRYYLFPPRIAHVRSFPLPILIIPIVVLLPDTHLLCNAQLAQRFAFDQYRTLSLSFTPFQRALYL